MCMKEYGCHWKLGRGDYLTSTLKHAMYGILGLKAQLLLNGSLHFNETLHSCSTQPVDMHEGIWLPLETWKGR